MSKVVVVTVVGSPPAELSVITGLVASAVTVTVRVTSVATLPAASVTL